MTRGLTPEDRKRVDELYKRGCTPAEIGHEIGKDARTVKSYLAQLEVERVSELVRLQDLQKHWEIIRDRVKSLKEVLVFPPPEHLDISDLSAGQRAYFVEGGVIRWHKAGSSYRVKLGEEFDCVLEHLRSSRRTSILKKLEQWQSIGGECIEDCHRLQAHIVERAKRETDLEIVLLDAGRRRPPRGLLDGFCWTIYSRALSGADTSGAGYKVVSKHDDLCLLSWQGDNLAWLRNEELNRLQGIHQTLIGYYRKLSITHDVVGEKKELDILSESLRSTLDRFASLRTIPGRCRECPPSEKIRLPQAPALPGQACAPKPR